MSRKGKLPITLPNGVAVKVTDKDVIVNGPKGSLTQPLIPGVDVTIEGNVITVSLKDENNDLDHFHGLFRTLIYNMVVGTTEGFEKKLEMIGVGYRAVVQGSLLDVQVGFSHPTKLEIPKGLTIKVDKNTLITVSGIDKHLVGQFAASIRSKRPPEPYQGKGIRYQGEFVRKKAGKAAAKK